MDPIIGASSDATRSRFGRRRPWFLASLPISVLFNVLLWTVWPGMDGNEGAQFAYFLIAYCMAVFGLGLFYIPYSAMPTTISSKDIDRVRLTTSRVFYMIFGDMVGVGVLAVCSILYPDDSNRSYQVAAGINSAIVAAVILVTFFGVPEPSSEHVRARHRGPTRRPGQGFAALRCHSLMQRPPPPGPFSRPFSRPFSCPSPVLLSPPPVLPPPSLPASSLSPLV